jgi:hypothetical protein
LVNILILRLCNYDKSPDHDESAGNITLRKDKTSKNNKDNLALSSRAVYSCSHFFAVEIFTRQDDIDNEL